MIPYVWLLCEEETLNGGGENNGRERGSHLF